MNLSKTFKIVMVMLLMTPLLSQAYQCTRDGTSNFYNCGQGKLYSEKYSQCTDMTCTLVFDTSKNNWIAQFHRGQLVGNTDNYYYYSTVPASVFANTTNTNTMAQVCPIAMTYPDQNKVHVVAQWQYAQNNCVMPPNNSGEAAVCSKAMGNGLQCGSVQCSITVGVDYGDDLPLAYLYKKVGDILPYPDSTKLKLQKTLLVDGVVVKQVRSPVDANHTFAWTQENIFNVCGTLISPSSEN